MERCVRVFRSFEGAAEADLNEWLGLSGSERLLIGEELRLEAYNVSSPRLQRVLRLVERKGDRVKKKSRAD